jgi:2-oxo-4-hydroxy-4-carboxy-5-ureidoimidazoline decarboxylase
MDLNIFNTLTKEEALSHLLSCCGSTTWASSIEKRRPFADVQSLISTAEITLYDSTTVSDCLEAFAHHPQIGILESL